MSFYFHLRIILVLSLSLLMGCSGFHKDPPPHEDELILKEGVNSLPVGSYLMGKVANAKSDPDLVMENETGWDGLRKPNVNFEFTTKDVWLKLPIRNLSSNEEFVLVLPNTRLNVVDFYWTDSHGIHATKNAGDHLPFEKEDLISYPYFKFKLHKGEVAKLWVRVNSDSHISFLPTLYTYSSFLEYANWREKEGLFQFLLIGTLILLYILVLKEASLTLKIILSFYTFFAFFYTFLQDGEGTRLLFTNNRFFRNYAFLICLTMGGLFFSQFLKEYFMLKNKMKWLRIVFDSISFIFFIGLFLIFSGIPNSILVQLRSTMFILTYIFMIFGIIYHIIQGHKWVLFYLFAKIIVTCFSVVEIMMLGGFLDYNPIIAMGISVGIQIEAIGILITLRMRERDIREEEEDIATYL